MDLTSFTDEKLVSDLKAFCLTEAKTAAQIVAYLSEVETRKIFVAEAHDTMFDFCVDRLGMSTNEAGVRLQVARLYRKHPDVLKPLVCGEVSLTSLYLLRSHITDENCASILERVSGMTTRQVEHFIAVELLHSKPRESIRRISSTPTLPNSTSGSASSASDPDAKEPRMHESEAAPHPDSQEVERHPVTAPTMEHFVEVTHEWHKIQFAATSAQREKIERAVRLSASRGRKRDLGSMFEQAVDLLLAALEDEQRPKARRPRKRRGRAHAAVETVTVSAPSALAGDRPCETEDVTFTSPSTSAAVVSSVGGRRDQVTPDAQQTTKENGELREFPRDDRAGPNKHSSPEVDDAERSEPDDIRAPSLIEPAVSRDRQRKDARHAFGRRFIERQLASARAWASARKARKELSG